MGEWGGRGVIGGQSVGHVIALATVKIERGNWLLWEAGQGDGGEALREMGIRVRNRGESNLPGVKMTKGTIEMIRNLPKRRGRSHIMMMPIDAKRKLHRHARRRCRGGVGNTSGGVPLSRRTVWRETRGPD
jgi:hypothetical protein